MVVLKELILNSFYFEGTDFGCGGLERTDFEQFLFFEGVVVLKEFWTVSTSRDGGLKLILNSFYFWRIWWSWKNWFWTVSTLGGCGSLERLILNRFFEGVVVLKEFWTVSTLGGCDGLERTDFEQFLLLEGLVVLKELILNSFYFGRVWWSWKNWFWTVSCLGGCGGLERIHFEQILLWEGRTNFEKFLLWEGLVVLKELILNSFYFGRVSGGLERTDFEQFLLWEGVVVLKELILNSFYFGRVWLSWKNWFWTVSTLGGSGSLERTDFEQFLLWEGVVVLKELILNSFYFGRVWWSWKNWFWTVSTLGVSTLGGGGLERTDFEQFLLWEGMVVLKELILNSFYFGRVWWSWKNSFWTVSTLGGCGGLERTDFEQFLLWEGVVVLKELILNNFYFGRVVVLKELILNSFYFGRLWWSWWFYFKVLKLILNSFYFGRVWWSWKNWFWTVSTLGGCGGLERTDFEQFLCFWEEWFWTVFLL